MSDKPLMHDAIAREVLYQNRYNASVADLLAALRGIASCGTACGCCRMHNEIAREAVERWEMAQHQPWCLSLDNVLGRHACDCGAESVA